MRMPALVKCPVPRHFRERSIRKFRTHRPKTSHHFALTQGRLVSHRPLYAMTIGDGVPTGTAQPAMRFNAKLAPFSVLKHDEQEVVTAATRSSTDVIPRIKDPAVDAGNNPRRKASRTHERAQRSLKFQIGTSSPRAENILIIRAWTMTSAARSHTSSCTRRELLLFFICDL